MSDKNVIDVGMIQAFGNLFDSLDGKEVKIQMNTEHYKGVVAGVVRVTKPNKSK